MNTKHVKRKRVLLLIFLLIFIQLKRDVRGEESIIKFATVATEGSTWMNVMNNLNNDVQKSTQGKLKFRMYSGGILGDEKDVLRKMRFGQVQSAGFTGMGLGEILPEIRVLELPYLYSNYNEADYITEKFHDRFSKAFEERGFVLLGWTEVGFVHIFTNTPVKSVTEMRKLKRMWVWEGDPLAEETFKSIAVNPIQLPLTDVLTSLQTGLIDGVYASPLGAVALQWFTKTKYMMATPMTDASGAILIDKNFFYKLPSDFQNILKEKCRSYLKELVKLSRKDNEEAIEVLKKNGIEVVELSEDAKKDFKSIGIEVRNKLIGKLYSKELLNEILTALDEFRMGIKK